jgi:hypothetical protein
VASLTLAGSFVLSGLSLADCTIETRGYPCEPQGRRDKGGKSKDGKGSVRHG